MGFSLELFIDEDINVELICTICNEVLKNPTLIDACEHAFCDSCIKQWNETSGNATCPVDRQAIEGFLRPQRPFMNMLNDLNLHCPFKNLGCNAVVKLGDILDHDQHCEFNPDNPKQCNGGCGAVLNQAQERTHNCMAFLKEQVKTMGEENKRLKLELLETRRAGTGPVAAAAGASGSSVSGGRPTAGNRGHYTPSPGTVMADEIQVSNVVNINQPLQMFNLVVAELQALSTGFARDSTDCRNLACSIKVAIERLHEVRVRRFSPLRWKVQVELYSESIVESTDHTYNFSHQFSVLDARVKYTVRDLGITIVGYD